MTGRALIPAVTVAAFALLAMLLQAAWHGRDAARREATAARGQAASAEAQGQLVADAARTAQAAQAGELVVTI